MRLSALNRLRLAFSGIGALLLLPLALLAHSVNERLEAQRRLRHEVVAERIFDELERELTAVLSREFARPSSAYDAASIDPGVPSPYVIGYFTSSEGRRRVLGAREPGGDREPRASWALDEWERRVGTSSAVPSLVPGSPAVPVQPAPASPRSTPEILKKLNRSERARSNDLGY